METSEVVSACRDLGDAFERIRACEVMWAMLNLRAKALCKSCGLVDSLESDTSAPDGLRPLLSSSGAYMVLKVGKSNTVMPMPLLIPSEAVLTGL